MAQQSSTLLSPESVTHYLTEFYADHLPISDYLGMRVHEYNGETFSQAIDLKPSINDKLTAFGGSLYSVCVMNCWGMCYLQARQRGINPNLVVSRGEIEYLAPVDDDVIIASCHAPQDIDWHDFYDSFASKGRARAKLSSTIVCGGREAVKFNGQYAIVGINEQ
jgi:thioesterase domain-containing protein